MGGLFLARAPFNVGERAARVGAWLVGWIRGWASGWLVLVARQLWLGRLPIDGLAWWVVVGRQADKLSGLLFGPTNHPIPRQQTAQPRFSTANLSSVGASVLAQAHPDMNSTFGRFMTPTAKPNAQHPSLSVGGHHQGRPPARATPLHRRAPIAPTQRFQSLGLCQPSVVVSPCSSCPMAPRCVPLACQARWTATCNA